jgi:hypothetical protein
MNQNTTTPQLAPPGAGLPWIERFIANLRIRWKARRVTRASNQALFEQERDVMLKILADCPQDLLAKPVLIARLRGLEDSSRYWSLLMVADHLRIVNREVAGVITALAAGRVPQREASIAGVKPSVKVTPAVIDEFVTGCDSFTEAVAAVEDLKTAAQFSHPWFGPMDAATWQFMAAFHMTLHRRQMERIRAGLAQASPT